MNTFDFDTASPSERNESIALALGWSKTLDGDYWMRPSSIGGIFGSKSRLPNWQGDDGLAFRELWPEIAKMFPGGIRLHQESKIFWITVYRPDGHWYNPMLPNSSSSAAHAICKAFLELRAEIVLNEENNVSKQC